MKIIILNPLSFLMLSSCPPPNCQLSLFLLYICRLFPSLRNYSQTMENQGVEENVMRTRSFRYEDYNNRRVFLRSYPLHWGGESEESNEEEAVKVTSNKSFEKKKPIKQIILSVFHWGGGKVLVLRRFKHKFTIYIIACVSVGFKSPTALISAKSWVLAFEFSYVFWLFVSTTTYHVYVNSERIYLEKRLPNFEIVYLTIYLIFLLLLMKLSNLIISVLTNNGSV